MLWSVSQEHAAKYETNTLAERATLQVFGTGVCVCLFGGCRLSCVCVGLCVSLTLRALECQAVITRCVRSSYIRVYATSVCVNAIS